MAYIWSMRPTIERNERFPDTEEVTGSNPVSPTENKPLTCGNAVRGCFVCRHEAS